MPAVCWIGHLLCPIDLPDFISSSAAHHLNKGYASIYIKDAQGSPPALARLSKIHLTLVNSAYAPAGIFTSAGLDHVRTRIEQANSNFEPDKVYAKFYSTLRLLAEALQQMLVSY